MNEWLQTVNIRLWRETDLPALEWDGEYSCYREVYKGVFRNYLRGRARPLLAETPADGVIGQVILTEIAASRSYDPCHSSFFLTSFRIKPAFRDCGLGSRILSVCDRETRQRGLPEIFLNCSRTNLRGVHFYRENGYRILREEETRWAFVDPEGHQHDNCEPSYLMVHSING